MNGKTHEEATAADKRRVGAVQGDSPLLAAARAYTRRGWWVVPVRLGEKGVTLSGWQNMRLGEDELGNWFGWFPRQSARDREELHNVGLLTGEPSGGLVDVDCDAPEAARAAAELLPPTGLVSGRASSRANHYWYRVDEGLPATTKYAVPVGQNLTPSPSPRRRGEPEPERPSPIGSMLAQALPSQGRVADRPGEVLPAPDHRSMLVELRSTGCQTIVPPSIHPSGEVTAWERGDPGRGEDGCAPGIVTGAALRRAVGRVAAAALLARCWPGEGQRDEAAKDLAGMLLRGGWQDVAAVDQFVTLVARIAGDEEWRQRAKAKGTAKKRAADGRVTGARDFAERLRDGERVVAQVVRWLGLPPACDWPPADERRGLDGAHRFSYGQSASYGQSPDMDTTGAESDWFVTGDAVEETRVNWLWPGLIPLGAITLLDGDPGLGKSLLTLDLAARVTTGRAMPLGAPGVADGAGVAGVAGVALLSAEDNIAATIIPRLRLAGADIARVGFVRNVPIVDATTEQTLQRSFVLPDDIPWLEKAIQRIAARLVVIDPLMSFLDGGVNSWRDQDVRRALAPLAALAERTGAAILILRHLNKATGGNPTYRGGGSIGIIGAARSGLLVAKHPDNPDHERVLTAIKSNLGPPMPSLRYQIVAPLSGIEGLEEEGIAQFEQTPVIEWLGESDLDAATLLAASAGEQANPTKVAEGLG